jgi:hypothetical protein
MVKIRKLCDKLGVVPKVFKYDREKPSGIEEELHKILDCVSGKLFVDISGMSRHLIVQLIVYLGNRPTSFRNVEILYCEAEEYPPDEANVVRRIERKEKWSHAFNLPVFLSSGVFGVSIVPELSSVALQGQPIRLVSFPSFSVEQLDALRSELQPSKYTFIHGIPPRKENAWRPRRIKELNRTNKIEPREDYDASTLNYGKTLDILIKVYQKHGVMDRLVISPTGSKMQSVAVGIFRAHMKDVQVVYPAPIRFPNPYRYTKGVRHVYSLNLAPFCCQEKR